MMGMMLHQDGSTHVWLAGQPALDLVITLDDATSAIYPAVLVEEEGTASTFRGLTEVIERHGLFIELYTDRGSHDFHTPEAGGPPAPPGTVRSTDRIGRPDGGDSLEDPAHPGRSGARAAGHRPHRRLLAAGEGPLRAGVPHQSHGGSVSGGADRKAIGGQDRLPKEFRLAGITTVVAANR